MAETAASFRSAFPNAPLRALRRQGWRPPNQATIGTVIQTLGMGPHRLQLPTRPDWFFDPEKFGGIIVDIASHQVDQFLFYTGSTSATVAASSVGTGMPDRPAFQDFGEASLRSDKRFCFQHPRRLVHARGIADMGRRPADHSGDRGSIELRKYIDISGRPGKDHLFSSTARR